MSKRPNFHFWTIAFVALLTVSAVANPSNYKLDPQLLSTLLGGNDLYGKRQKEKAELYEHAAEVYDQIGAVLLGTENIVFAENILVLFRKSKGDKSVPIRFIQEFIEVRANQNGWEQTLEDAKRSLEECTRQQEAAKASVQQKQIAREALTSSGETQGPSRRASEKSENSTDSGDFWRPMGLLFVVLATLLLFVFWRVRRAG